MWGMDSRGHNGVQIKKKKIVKVMNKVLKIKIK